MPSSLLILFLLLSLLIQSSSRIPCPVLLSIVRRKHGKGGMMVPDPFILLYLISRYFMEGQPQLAATGDRRPTAKRAHQPDCCSFILICARIKASVPASCLVPAFMRISWIQAEETSEYTLTQQFNQEWDKKGGPELLSDRLMAAIFIQESVHSSNYWSAARY